MTKDEDKSLMKMIIMAMWCILGGIAAITAIFLLNSGWGKMFAISEAKRITPCLAYPDSLVIDEIYTFFLKTDVYITYEDNKITEETERLDELLGDRPVVTYIRYFASDRNNPVVEREEWFILIRSKPIRSIGENGTRAVTPEFEEISKFYGELPYDAAILIFDDWQNEVYDIDADVEYLNQEDIALYSKLPGFLKSLAGAAILALVAHVAYILARARQRGKKDLSKIGIAEALIESAYPTSLLPVEYRTFKVDKKACCVWVELGVLCLLQSKRSIMRKARKNPELYSSEEKIKGKIYQKRIAISDICDVISNDNKTCMVCFREDDELKTLIFSANAMDFIAGAREPSFGMPESAKSASESVSGSAGELESVPKSAGGAGELESVPKSAGSAGELESVPKSSGSAGDLARIPEGAENSGQLARIPEGASAVILRA